MSIDATSSTSSLQAKSLGMEDFIKILLTQLTFQDPLKPMDNQEFMAQMAQFTALEQTQQLNEKMSLLITNQAALQSVGLIGRTVDFVSKTGAALTGVVSSLALNGDAPLLSVTTSDGQVVTDVGLGQISQVR
jgi:flagellar basal-body rod modification protein FlgD